MNGCISNKGAVTKNYPNHEVKAAAWFETLMIRVFENSNLTPDSTSFEYYPTNVVERIETFQKGFPLLIKLFDSSGILKTELRFANETFQLRRDYCLSGQIIFQAILYNGEVFGPVTSFTCDQKTKERGIMINGRKIGYWKQVDEFGKLIFVNYKSTQLIDSLPVLPK